MNNETKKFWDEIFSESEGFQYGGAAVPGVMEILKYISKGDLIEIGCGDGRNLINLGKKGNFKLAGLDISEVALEKLKRFSGELDIELICSGIENFSFNKPYDVILCIFVLHIFEPEIALQIIEKIKVNTKIGGYNFIVTFTGEDLPADFKFKPSRDMLSHQIYGADKRFEVLELNYIKSKLKRDQNSKNPKEFISQQHTRIIADGQRSMSLWKLCRGFVRIGTYHF